MSDDTPPVKLAFGLIAELGCALGAAPVTKFPGCWEYCIDATWELSFNGHAEAHKSAHGVEVPARHCYIQYNGWPAGLLNPFGGTIAAGDGANEDTFIAALTAAIERMTAARPGA